VNSAVAHARRGREPVDVGREERKIVRPVGDIGVSVGSGTWACSGELQILILGSRSIRIKAESKADCEGL
jgi:hypothetical protein